MDEEEDLVEEKEVEENEENKENVEADPLEENDTKITYKLKTGEMINPNHDKSDEKADSDETTDEQNKAPTPLPLKLPQNTVDAINRLTLQILPLDAMLSLVMRNIANQILLVKIQPPFVQNQLRPQPSSMQSIG